MGPKDADRMANSVDPEQSDLGLQSVCTGPSVRKLRNITVSHIIFMYLNVLKFQDTIRKK